MLLEHPQHEKILSVRQHGSSERIPRTKTENQPSSAECCECMNVCAYVCVYQTCSVMIK
jgi:hypothetical protein